MLRPRLPILAVMSLQSLFGSSPRSTDWPASLTSVRVEIRIEHSAERGDDTRDSSHASILAVLYHAKGRAIERRDVALEVNGVPLEFRVRTGNYYDRHPYYRLHPDSPLQITPATAYRFVLTTPDGTKHPVGEVITPERLDLDQFTYPRQPPAGPVALAWRDLAEPAQLTVYRSNRWREAANIFVHEAGSPTDPTALRRQIGGGLFRRKSDSWTIPAAFLQPIDGHELSALAVDIRVTHRGQIEQTFAQGSTLQAERWLTLRMVVPEK
ncbi:MAG: hypothetical protein JNL92_09810 [Opitutaceae bacterium]|nr:hypothetical protein [Opitutaceae bacterium]